MRRAQCLLHAAHDFGNRRCRPANEHRVEHESRRSSPCEITPSFINRARMPEHQDDRAEYAEDDKCDQPRAVTRISQHGGKVNPRNPCA